MFKLAKRYLGSVKQYVIIGQTSKLIEAIFEVIVPLIMAAIVDNGIKGNMGKGYVYKMGGVLILLGVLGLCFALIEGQAVIMKKLDDIENEAKITRNAVNYSSDKLEELITLLNETNVISMKY